MTSCLSDLALERLHAGEAAGVPTLIEARAHVDACSSCTLRLKQVADAPAPATLDLATRPSPWWLRFGPRVWTATGLVLAGACALLFVRSTPVEEDLTKGGRWRLGVFALADGVVTRVLPGQRLRPGDRLRFEVSTAGKDGGYVALVSFDAAGVVSAVVPARGATPQVPAGKRVLLDEAVELDATPGRERLMLLGCDRPRDMTDVMIAAKAALARAKGKASAVEDLGLGCHQETFWIEKDKR